MFRVQISAGPLKMITIKEFKQLKFKNKNPIEVEERIAKNLYGKLIEYIDISNKNILVICGNTNKGNLGFILARYLRDSANVNVLFLDKREKLEEEFKINYFKILGNVKYDQNLIYNSDIIIDSMLDNEVKGFVREPYKSTIVKYNDSKAYKAAIDYPSGLNPDTGIVIDVSTNNDLILTIHDTKKGLMDYNNVVIVDSGLK